MYQSLDFEDCKPSSSEIFSVENPLMAPAMASPALCSSDSSLAQKGPLDALSYIIFP